MQHRQHSTADRPVAGAVTTLPDDPVVGRESHGNASHGNAPTTAIRDDGTEPPARFGIREPSFSNLRALPTVAMAAREVIADLDAAIGSLDAAVGEVGR